MPLTMIRQDITKIKTDAVVSAVRFDFSDTGGAEGALQRAGGVRLRMAIRKLGSCPVGEARITKGYRLPAKYVIHTAGPIWQGGGAEESEKLAACYRSSLELAAAHRCKSIAFPLISTGAGGFPGDRAMRIAAETIRVFLETHDMMVYLVFYDDENYRIGTELYGEITRFIDDRSIMRRMRTDSSSVCAVPLPSPMDSMPFSAAAPAPHQSAPAGRQPMKPGSAARRRIGKSAARNDTGIGKNHSAKTVSPEDMTRELTQLLRQTDESFSQMLLRKIDESGMTDAECYKKANIDRKLFSKIRSDMQYRPSKMTVLAFAVALEMNLEETEDFLKRAGFALSPSSKADLILEYFIEREIYDIFLINEALFAFDQRLLGG